MNFANKLYELRKQNNMTQEQLAEKLNVSRQSVSKWESGAAYPEMDKLLAISKLFNCPLDVLTGDSELKCEQEEKKGYFNKFLDTINKLFCMFTKLKFNDLLKIFVEFLLLILLMAILKMTILEMIVDLIRNLFSFLPKNGYLVCNGILTFVVDFAYLVLCMVIIGYLFNERYLKNFDGVGIKAEFNYKKEKVVEEVKVSDNEEVKETEKVKYVYLPNNHFSIIDLIAKFLLIFAKFIVIWFLIAAIVIVFCLIIGFCIDIWLMFKGILFIGLFIGLLSSTIVGIECIIIMINFLFDKKSSYKALLWIFICGFVGVAIGVGVGTIEFTDFNVTDEVPEVLKLEYNEKYYDMTDDFFISGNDVEYIVDNSLDNIKILYGYNAIYELNSTYYSNNELYVYVSENINFTKLKDLIINFLKNKEIYDGTYYPDVKVYANEENIAKMKVNKMNDYRNSYDEERNSLYERINELESQIDRDNERYQEALDSYQGQLKEYEDVIEEYQNKIKELESILN